jgi:hypothetical protein
MLASFATAPDNLYDALSLLLFGKCCQQLCNRLVCNMLLYCMLDFVVNLAQGFKFIVGPIGLLSKKNMCKVFMTTISVYVLVFTFICSC